MRAGGGGLEMSHAGNLFNFQRIRNYYQRGPENVNKVGCGAMITAMSFAGSFMMGYMAANPPETAGAGEKIIAAVAAIFFGVVGCCGCCVTVYLCRRNLKEGTPLLGWV